MNEVPGYKKFIFSSNNISLIQTIRIVLKEAMKILQISDVSYVEFLVIEGRRIFDEPDGTYSFQIRKSE